MLRLRLAFAILITALFVGACATKRIVRAPAAQPPTIDEASKGVAKEAPAGRAGGRGGRGATASPPPAGAPAAAAPQPTPPPPVPPRMSLPVEELAGALPEIPATATARGAGPARPATRPPRSEIEIFYGTNRARRSTCEQTTTVKWDSPPACRPNSFYVGEPSRRDDSLEVGRFKVSFPPNHQPGQIERPRVFTIEWRGEDPLRDVLISDLSSFGTDYDAWVRAVKATGKSDAFIYVHGYNTSFEYAARQAGQLAFDLEIDRDFGGVPMLYSWPSRGTLKGYGADYDRSRAAARAFNQFLDLVKQRAGLSRVHIVAHSMGNRLVANALLDRWSEGRKEKFLEQLVLAAPDVSAEDFRDQFLKTLPQLAKRVTLYVSDNDKALRTSTGLRDGIPRAGLLEGGLMDVTEPGFEVVDATPLPADFLDHSYYSTNRSMLADIYCLLGDSSASGRPLIMARGVNWIFKPAAELAGLKEVVCRGRQGEPEASTVPPPMQPPAPPPVDSDSTRWWLTGLMALVAAAAAGYVIARRRRQLS